MNIKFRKSSYKLAGNGSSKVVSAGSKSSTVGIAKTSTIAIGTRVGISRVAIAITSTIASIGSSKLGLGLSLSLSIESPVSKTITMSSIAKVSIAIGSRVGVSRVAQAISSSVAIIAIEAIVSSVGGSQVLGISLGLSFSLSLAIVVTLGHWVKALGDGIQTRAGAEGDSGIGIASMAKTRVAIAQTRVASIAESTIAIASIGISSIAKLSLSRGSGNKGRNNLKNIWTKLLRLELDNFPISSRKL